METQPYTVYEYYNPLKSKQEKYIPGSPGLGTQFYTDFQIIDSYGMPAKATVQSLLDNGYIKIVKVMSP